MRILAIDPGPTKCGWAVLDAPEFQVVDRSITNTERMPYLISAWQEPEAAVDIIAIEMIASYGMAVGKDVFDTCVWIGRLMQSAKHPDAVRLVYRKDVKLHLCGSPRAKDSNIRQALIDKLGPPGTKKNPGRTYGVTSHAWAALAVAVTVAEGGA